MKTIVNGNGQKSVTGAEVLALLVKNGIITKDVADKVVPEPEKAENKGWDTAELVGSVTAKSGKSATKVSITTKDDMLYIDLRKFVNKKGQEGFNQHTMKGIAMEVEDIAEIDQIISLLQRARSKASNKLALKKAVAQ